MYAPVSKAVASNAYVLLAVAALSFVTGLTLSHGLQLNAHWPSYADMLNHLDHPGAWLRWVLGDLSEFAFYKHELAGLGLLAGAGLAWWANSTGKRWQGFAISFGSGLWPWLVTSSLMGLLLSNLLWGWTISTGAWQPTFVTFISLPAATVLVFGRGWRVAVIGAVSGALLVMPISLLLVNYLCVQTKLPNMVGAALGMAAGSAIAFWLYRRYPDVLKPTALAPLALSPPAQTTYGVVWGIRRMLADFSEAPFFGNELASLGLLSGVLLAHILNPDSTAYGSNLLLPILSGQGLTSAIGIYLWRGHWMTKGWYPTYIPLVSVVPASVIAHGGGFLIVSLSAILGALIAPPLASAIAARLPGWMPPFIANMLSMGLSTALIVPFIGALIAANH